ncbi:hypothetical protein POM88_034643 [Heracleum sosnowskyi]|uniref:Cyclin N-terminal domain-containing protein n=1 Tax=Heracleum sosnowskyi TaxID=360622 RepID=A0AAD8MCI7_9APIA|nr:hypothetical protein POM88_034643 [Heracleum sosnowskyi]
MLIAAKYEEINPPHVDDFCYITDNTYTKDKVVKMEADVLKSLKFEMGNPTAKTFLRKYNSVAQETQKEDKVTMIYPVRFEDPIDTVLATSFLQGSLVAWEAKIIYHILYGKASAHVDDRGDDCQIIDFNEDHEMSSMASNVVSSDAVHFIVWFV